MDRLQKQSPQWIDDNPAMTLALEDEFNLQIYGIFRV